MDAKAKAERRKISASLAKRTCELSNDILALADEYLSGFDSSKQFSFSSARNDKEKHEQAYYRFAASLIDSVRGLSSANAELSSLLIESDRKMDVELILALQKRFDAFEIFEHSLYEYTSSVEAAFDNGAPSMAFLINSANKFKLAVKNLINENS